jgi:hypothetical protein
MPNASTTVRAAFQSNEMPLTMNELIPMVPNLRKNEISMALCYLLKQGYLSRQRIDRLGTRGRKEVWQYTFNKERVIPTKVQIESNEL